MCFGTTIVLRFVSPRRADPVLMKVAREGTAIQTAQDNILALNSNFFPILRRGLRTIHVADQCAIDNEASQFDG